MSSLDQDKASELTQEITESTVTPEISATATEEQTTPTTPDLSAYTKPELIAALKELVAKEVDQVKDDVENIKQLFYKKHKIELEEKKKLFVENGGDENEFISEKDENEEELKVLLNEFKSKKAVYIANLEKEKENNLLLKQHIIEQMKSLVDNNQDVSAHVNDFRELQKKWKSIGQVPATAATDLWKTYSALQESFWDLIKINNELRDYDFKKNLELKTQLCEAAERLDNETDIVSAFQSLQKLHDEWHELGPVARDLREQVWTRFKEASAVINKKHQSHFDNVRKLEEDNYEAKVALCEKIEAFEYKGFNVYKQWDDATKIILGWQDEWRTIGFAPRKVNQKIFDRYRKACDAFFAAKAEFYKETKSVLNQNMEKKRALCEQAEALKESTDWKATSEKLVQLQKEWKTIGPVSKKFSDELWKQFIAACDYFFEQKNKNSSGQKNIETENLQKKKELITKIQELDVTGNSSEAVAKLREMMAEWNNIGHVPFKEKDKIYKEFRAAVDKQFEVLNVDASQRRLDSFKNNLKDMSTKGENKLFREREKLVRAYEHLNAEIATYENNIGFFTSSSKKGGGLIKEMERKIEALKEEAKLIEQKINMIIDAIQ